MIHGINIYDEKVIVFRDEFLVFHLFPFINRAQDWLPFLGPLGQANLCFLIGVRRISGKIYLFSGAKFFLESGLERQCMLPSEQDDSGSRTIEKRTFPNVRQQSLKSRFS